MQYKGGSFESGAEGNEGQMGESPDKKSENPDFKEFPRLLSKDDGGIENWKNCLVLVQLSKYDKKEQLT